MKKRLISLMVTMVMVFSLIPTSLVQATGNPPAGLGSEASPYLIADLDDLVWIVPNNEINKSFLGKFFRQTANIDISSIDNWTPIGKGLDVFQGTYDGNGHTISGLKYSGDAESIGLFSKIVYTATVKNLGVINININSSGDFVGGLAGWNTGKITNCYATGTVSGKGAVGGLVGRIVGVYAAIVNSYATGAVSGSGNSIGGLVGSGSGGEITNCYSTGVVGGNDDNVGGLMGVNTGKITNCYATGTVSGKRAVGGLIGFSSGNETITNCYSTGNVSGSIIIGGLAGSSSETIRNCYSTSTVSGNDGIVGGLVGSIGGEVTNSYATGSVSGSGVSVGGLAGQIYNGEIINCYYVDSNGVNGIGPYRNIEVISTQQTDISFYKNLPTYSNASNWNSAYLWDFTGIWAISDSINNGYPYLLTNTPQTAEKPISVMLNDKAISFDQPPIIENDRVLVPLRAIFEAMGATIAWDEATLTVTAIVGDITIKLQIGNKIADKNGQKISLDVPAMVVNDRTLVPIRFIAESMGAKVDWDEASKSVIITK